MQLDQQFARQCHSTARIFAMNETGTWVATNEVEVLLALDGSRKYRFPLEDGWHMEAAYFHVPGRDRPEIACVSTQVGCAIGCRFCATAHSGFQRNLSTAEIVLEISTILEHELARGRAEKDFEISFMGMGEPLANWSCVRSAIDEIHALYPDITRVAISTAGPPQRIQRLAHEVPARPFVHLQISLHATNDTLRHRLIPHAAGSIADLLAAGRLFHERTGDHICLNYVLLQGLNDSEADAEWLSQLDREVFYIKVTQLNMVPNLPPDLVGCPLQKLYQFCRWLESRRMPHKLFIGDGLDVQASCGQMTSVPLAVKSWLGENLV